MTKPKSRYRKRDWDFLREIYIVTIGVLIALAIGEAADFLRWQMRVRNSMAGVREDLADARYTLLERQVMQPCIAAQLQLVETALGQARKTHRLPRIRGLAISTQRKFEFATWEVAKSEGVTLHMDRATAVGIGHIYSGLQAYPAGAGGPETMHWSQLMALQDAAGPIDPSSLADFAAVFHQARMESFVASEIANEQADAIRKLGIPVLWGDYYPAQRRNRAGIARALHDWGVCNPLTLDDEPFAAKVE